MLFLGGVALDAVGGALGIVEGIFFPDFAAKTQVTTRGEGAFALALLLVAVGSIAVFAATAAAFCVWAYKAAANTRALGAQGHDFTPGWTVAWFFVPIMMLWKPLQAVKEIARASAPEAAADNWRGQQAPPLLNWWWAAWIVSQIVNRVDLKIAMSKDPAVSALSPWISTLSALPNIAAGLLALMVVRLIHARQRKKAQMQELIESPNAAIDPA